MLQKEECHPLCLARVRPAVKKVLDTVVGVGPQDVLDHDRACGPVGLVQRLAQLGLERAFAQADRGRVLGGDALRKAKRFGVQLVGGHKAVHHPKRMGPGGGQEIAGG